MFLMTAFIVARRATRTGLRSLWILVIGSWLLALACKEIAVMFPFALLAYDYLVAPMDREERRRRFWRIHAPLIGGTLLLGIVRVSILVALEPENATLRWRFALVELDVFRRYVQMVLCRRDRLFSTRSTRLRV